MILDGLIALALLGMPYLVDEGLLIDALLSLAAILAWFYVVRPTWFGLHRPALTALILLNPAVCLLWGWLVD